MMEQARWSIWLLNKDQPPSCYFHAMQESLTEQRLLIAAKKVFDGSDADAMILVRSDKHPGEYI